MAGKASKSRHQRDAAVAMLDGKVYRLPNLRAPARWGRSGHRPV